MRKIKLVIEYDGYKYHGWQVQPNGITIQSVLEEKLRLITKKKTSVIVAGRTDAKVHAEAQAAHFVTRSRMTPKEFLMALNSVLPKDISIKKVEEVDSDFHARPGAEDGVRKLLYRREGQEPSLGDADAIGIDDVSTDVNSVFDELSLHRILILLLRFIHNGWRDNHRLYGSFLGV